MARQLLQNFLLSFVFPLLISGHMMGTESDNLCSIGLGQCGQDCNQRCLQMHPGDKSHGDCDYTMMPPLCTCYYDCNPSPPAPPSPPPAKKCHSNNGVCSIASCDDQCCTNRCKSTFSGSSEVSGLCQEIVGTPYRLCLCEYDC